MNVCAYCRVSTDRDDQTNSFENQKEYFEKQIEQHPEWNLIEIYADEGVTGTNTKKRKRFNQMIGDARKGKIDLILTKEVTRFARNTVDTLKYTRELKDMDVRVIFLIDHIDTFDPDGEFRLTIMASLAQEESRKTSERVKWGIAQQMKKGFTYSPSLIGYDVHKGVITVNKEEAKIVKQIFDWFVCENKTAYGIARDLIAQGVKPVKRIKNWRAELILRILRNEKYVGDLIQRKRYVKNFLTHKSVLNEDVETMFFATDHHEPIIDRETWDLAQQRLNSFPKKPKDSSRFKTSNKYWCSGKIKCGICNTNFSVKTKKLATGELFKSWACISNLKFGAPKINGLGESIGCSNSQINIKALEECVKFAYEILAQDSPFLLDDFKNELRLSEAFSGKDEYSMDDLKRKKNTIEEKKKKIIDMYVDGLVSKEEFRDLKVKYCEEEFEINKNIDELNNLNANIFTLDDRIDSVKNRIDKIIENNEYQNDFLYNRIVESIKAFPNMLEIYFVKIPFPVKVKYQTSGRGENYTVNCEHIMD